jgi:hypothetical protein
MPEQIIFEQIGLSSLSHYFEASITLSYCFKLKFMPVVFSLSFYFFFERKKGFSFVTCMLLCFLFLIAWSNRQFCISVALNLLIKGLK